MALAESRPQDARRVRIGPWLLRAGAVLLGLIIGVAIVVRVVLLVEVGLVEDDEFTAYYSAAWAVAEGRNPYEWLVEGRPLVEDRDYHYTPTLAMLLAPLAPMLDYPTARWAWLGFSALCLVVGVALVWRTSGLRLRGGMLVAVLPFVTLLPAAISSLGTGTISPQLLLAIAVAYAALLSRRPEAAGGALALAAHVKSFPALLGGYLLLRREWRALAAAIVSGIALLALSIAVVGWGPHWDYVNHVVPAQRRWFGMPLNISINGFVTRLFTENAFAVPVVAAGALAQVAIAASVLALLALTAVAIWRAHDRAGQAVAFGLAVVAMLLVSPINGQYNLVIAILPLAIVTARVQAERPRHLRWLLVVLLLLSLPVEPCDLAPLRDACVDESGVVAVKELFWRQGWGNLLVSGPFFGLLALWALLLRLGQEAAQPAAARPARSLAGQPLDV